MSLDFTTVIFKIICGFCGFMLLTGCSSPAPNTNDTRSVSKSSLVIDKNMFLPIMDEPKTQSMVYINNITDQEISYIKYEFVEANNNLTHNLIRPINLNSCATIAPHSSCLITFVSSNLEYEPSLIMEDSASMALVNYGTSLSSNYTLQVSF